MQWKKKVTYISQNNIPSPTSVIRENKTNHKVIIIQDLFFKLNNSCWFIMNGRWKLTNLEVNATSWVDKEENQLIHCVWIFKNLSKELHERLLNGIKTQIIFEYLQDDTDTDREINNFCCWKYWNINRKCCEHSGQAATVEIKVNISGLISFVRIGKEKAG